MSFRTGSEGFWTIFLIPLAIFLQDEQRVYKPILIILTLNSVILALFEVTKQTFQGLLSEFQKINFFFSALTFVYCTTKGGDPYVFFSYIAVNFAFPHMFTTLTRMFPKSFTFGEAIIICQAFFTVFWAATMTMLNVTTSVSVLSHTALTIFFGHLGFLVCIILNRALLFIRKPMKFSFLDSVFFVWAVWSIAEFLFQCSFSEIRFLAEWFVQLLATGIRAKLIVFWLILTVASLGFASIKILSESQANTRDRKYFHFIMVMVFVPGILLDFSLIYIASIAATCAFIILEVARLLRLNIFNIPIGDIIDNCVQMFRDSQDEGIMILTPIYLMAGCSLPLWFTLVDTQTNVTVVSSQQVAAALAGILSIGIGDTFASIGGSKYGRTMWKGSLKTVEGTMFSILSQIVFILFLWMADLTPFSTNTVVSLVIASVVCSLVEAKTDQIDNLVLPLLGYVVIVGVQRVLDWYAISTHRNLFDTVLQK